MTLEEKQALASTIKSLSERDHEILYALIRAYQLQHNPTTVGVFPYEGKHLKNKGIRFDVSALPTPLQRMLQKLIFSDRASN